MADSDAHTLEEARKKADAKLKQRQPGFSAWRKAEEEKAAADILTNNIVGAVMPDGTVYAGISPETNKPLFAMPENAPLKMMFRDAAEYAEALDAHGHQDWRVPTMKELEVLYQNKTEGALQGTFNKEAASNGDRYWSSVDGIHVSGWVLIFSGAHAGAELDSLCGQQLYVRCVR